MEEGCSTVDDVARRRVMVRSPSRDDRPAKRRAIGYLCEVVLVEWWSGKMVGQHEWDG